MKKTILTLVSACLFFSMVSCSSDNNESKNGSFSPYIHKVFEFKPSVGQFVNDLPMFKKGDTYETILAKVNKDLVGSKPSMVSLGGFGGYIVFGFDHMVENKAGFCDFRVLGNAFMAIDNPNQSRVGGSCEPGVIMVSYDANNNGLPDDEWYEIAGSEHNNGTDKKNYSITYFKPDPNKPAIPGEAKHEIDKEYIRWEDSEGNTGWKVKNSFHRQSYYPEWIKEDKITFTGTLLRDNAIDESGEGTFWVLYPYDYGYVDNFTNSDDRSAIDINWAVDKDGNPANLPGIHFVRVHTGINQEAGWLGEVSTEVAGAYDLHLKNETIKTIK